MNLLRHLLPAVELSSAETLPCLQALCQELCALSHVEETVISEASYRRREKQLKAAVKSAPPSQLLTTAAELVMLSESIRDLRNEHRRNCAIMVERYREIVLPEYRRYASKLSVFPDSPQGMLRIRLLNHVEFYGGVLFLGEQNFRNAARDLEQFLSLYHLTN